MYNLFTVRRQHLDENTQNKKAQRMMVVGAALCVAAAVLSFFISIFSGIMHTVIVTLLLFCTFGGILLVGLGIRAGKRTPYV